MLLFCTNKKCSRYVLAVDAEYAIDGTCPSCRHPVRSAKIVRCKNILIGAARIMVKVLIGVVLGVLLVSGGYYGYTTTIDTTQDVWAKKVIDTVVLNSSLEAESQIGLTYKRVFEDKTEGLTFKIEYNQNSRRLTIDTGQIIFASKWWHSIIGNRGKSASQLDQVLIKRDGILIDVPVTPELSSRYLKLLQTEFEKIQRLSQFPSTQPESVNGENQ